MTKNKKRTLAVIAIVFIAFSMISFVVPFKRNDLFWLSYLFGVFAIAIQIYVMKIAFGSGESIKSKIYGFPVARIGFLYMMFQVVLSLIFMILANIAPMWLAALLYILALAAGAIGFIGTDAMKEETIRQDAKIKNDIACMMKLRTITASLSQKCDDAGVKRELSNLADEFRYSDPVSSGALKNIEAELEMAVDELKKMLESGDHQNASDACNKVKELLAMRNRQCKLNK